jgi:hypothetical protein
MEYKSVFYPTEMDLYDALYSNTQKVTLNYLLELARDRGIVLSPEEDREYLTRYISLLNYDYFEFKGVSNQVARSSHNDKISSEVIKEHVSTENITEAFKILKQYRSQKQEKYQMTQVDQNTVRIGIKYDEIDHSKTKLIQKIANEASVDIITNETNVKLRYTASSRAVEVKDSIVECFEKIKEKKINPIVITFEGISDTNLRTRFFTELISDIKGYNLENVSKLKLSSRDSLSIEEQEEIEDLEDEIVSFIRKVSYDGNHLLNSPEYKQLEKIGYFITCIRWILIERGKNPNKVEIEALFDHPEKGTGYKYSIRGIYRAKDGYYTHLRPAKPEEEKIVLSKIEASSNKIFNNILKMSLKRNK